MLNNVNFYQLIQFHVKGFYKKSVFMPTVKIMQHGQITIPKKFREILGLKKGDLAEAELEGERLVITPKKLVKDKALEELFALMDRVHERNNCLGNYILMALNFWCILAQKCYFWPYIGYGIVHFR